MLFHLKHVLIHVFESLSVEKFFLVLYVIYPVRPDRGRLFVLNLLKDATFEFMFGKVIELFKVGRRSITNTIM